MRSDSAPAIDAQSTGSRIEGNNVCSNTWASTTPNPLTVNEYGFKGDYVLNSKNRLSGLYVMDRTPLPTSPPYPLPWAEAISRRSFWTAMPA